MKTILACFFIMVCLFSCKKDKPSATDTLSIILTGHTWYPYEAYIQSYDTVTVTVYDSAGTHSTSQDFLYNISFLTEPCIQDSRLYFQKNNTMKITNPCLMPQTDTDTSWSLSQDSLLNFVSINSPSIDRYFYGLAQDLADLSVPRDSVYDLVSVKGAITSISNSQFTIRDADRTASGSIARYNGNTLIDSLTKITSRVSITYKAVK